MNYAKKICSFTGYRTQKLNACFSKSNITTEIIMKCLELQLTQMLDRGFLTFQCGMALGSDLMFARAVLQLKQRYSEALVRFVAVFPCLEHDRKWVESERRLCREIAGQADEVVMVSEYPYFKGCMAKRNRYLADNCDELMAIYDGQIGGTMQTINYAKEKGKKVTIIDPTRELIITLRESHKTEKQIKELCPY
ncbi:MAG: SLOG family protein [Oscillospiraceae bacterium]|nr:SLOG family protein [Oscillospiraceae bacterium]